jgi:hypothetical protein
VHIYDLTSVYFLCNTIYGCVHLKIGMPVKKQGPNVVGCQLKHIYSHVVISEGITAFVVY